MIILKKGFTIVELMVSITIVALIVSVGISAYARARDRQIIQTASEKVLAILLENQKIAAIGKKDCPDKFSGQRLVFSTTNTVTIQTLCESSVGATELVTISEISSQTGSTLVFEPLTSAIDLGGQDTITLNFTTSNGVVFSVIINRFGLIEFQGIQSS